MTLKCGGYTESKAVYGTSLFEEETSQHEKRLE
jgi:hypothetical protein